MAEKILVIDDEIETLRLLKLTLEREGFQVITASLGSIGLEQAQSRNADLIIIDIMLPDMDGFEIIRRIRKDPLISHIPILIFSARSQIDDKVNGYDAGADDYLTKPIHPSELVSHVKSLLNRSKERTTPVSKPGYCIGVIAAKGGLGTSTLAINLAIGLFQRSNKSLIAAELRPGHGSWKIDTDTTQSRTLARLLHMNPEKITRQIVMEELVLSSFGPTFLLSGNQPRDIEKYEATNQVEIVIQQLSLLTPLLLLDIGTIFWSNYSRIIRRCQHIVLVTEPNKITLDHTQLLIQDLAAYDFGKTKPLSIVSISRFPSQYNLPQTKIQTILNQPLQAQFPPIPEEAYQSEYTRTPVIFLQPDGIYTQQINLLADTILKNI